MVSTCSLLLLVMELVISCVCYFVVVLSGGTRVNTGLSLLFYTSVASAPAHRPDILKPLLKPFEGEGSKAIRLNNTQFSCLTILFLLSLSLYLYLVTSLSSFCFYQFDCSGSVCLWCVGNRPQQNDLSSMTMTITKWKKLYR